jgi:glycosyltransferase involved in cell wall biosynthesis
MILPRKVLHVLNGASGGAALSTLGLISSFREMGIDACAVCHNMGLPGDFDALRDATRGNLLVTPLYWWNRKLRPKWWKRPLLEARQLYQTGFVRGSTRRVVEFAKSQNPDLIHSNTILTLEGGYAARQLGLPHVWHLRELVGPGHRFRFFREGPAFGKLVAKNADRLVANSHVSASLVREWLPPGLLEVVPNGIDIERFAPKNHKASNKPVVVGMVANLTSEGKGHDLVIEIAARVYPSLPITWRFYGLDPSQGGQVRGKPYLDRMHERIKESGLQDRFRFMGHIANPTQIMSEIDVLIHTCNHESFGRVIVEAMAAGLPVVGVAAGALNEIVVHGQTGYLYAADDFDTFAKTIETLVMQPELRNRIGKEGRKRASDNFSLDACAQSMAHIYSELMKTSVAANRTGAQPAAATSVTYPT